MPRQRREPNAPPLPKAQDVRDVVAAIQALLPKLVEAAPLLDQVQTLEDQVDALQGQIAEAQQAREQDEADAVHRQELLLAERAKSVKMTEDRIEDLERQRADAYTQVHALKTKITEDARAWEQKKKQRSAEHESQMAELTDQRNKLQAEIDLLHEQMRELHAKTSRLV